MSRANAEQNANSFFIFIEYSPQSMQSIGLLTDHLLAVKRLDLREQSPPFA
jgi:hypothetical protein